MDTPALTVRTEDGFVDLSLRMEAGSRDTNNRYRFEARAIHGESPIAIAIILGTTWEAKEVEGNSTKFLFYWGEVELVSVGPESDAFIRTLDRLYEARVRVTHMRQSTHFTAVCLEGNPDRLPAESLKMKLFFESGQEELCAEFYLNCDFRRQSVQFHEKDQDYRRPLVLALGMSIEN